MRVLLFFILLACSKPSNDPCRAFGERGHRCLSLANYQQKMRAAWLGQMVGVSYAQPVEFLYRGRIIPTNELPTWSATQIQRAFFEDDLLVDVSFVDAIIKNGISLDREQLEQHFAKTQFPLWHANDAARERIRAGLSPSNQHSHASDIDYQIEADFSGLISPGMPHRVLALADTFGTMICDGECVDGGKFIGCLYAEAFFTDEIPLLIESALKCIPDDGVYERTIRDVLRWYQESPDDWLPTWQKIEAEYNKEDSAHCKGSNPEKEGAGFNINASLNGAYVVVGLLYGEKDVERTLKITTQLGQDADCNASSALGVLFTILGESKIPSPYWPEVSPLWKFRQTEYTLPELLFITEKIAREHCEKHAKLQTTINGEALLFPLIP
jgi:hypothetical protein